MISSRDRAALGSANGTHLAQLIARLTPGIEQLADADALEFIHATARLEAWVTAQRATAIAAYHAGVLAAAEHMSDELDAIRLAHGGHSGQGGTKALAGASHRFDEAVALDREVGTEIALKLGVPARTADREIHLALELARWPVVHQALQAGRIDKNQARVILEEIDTLTDPLHQVALLASLLGPEEDFDGDEEVEAELLTLQGLDGVDPW